MSLVIFKEKELDYCVIETGMGGRYDATNVITPRVSVITTISVDHREFLGETLEEIAYHKAGIIKEKVPVVCAPQSMEVIKVIEDEVSKKGTKVTMVSEDNLKICKKLGKRIDFLRSNAYDRNEYVSENVLGQFQYENFAVARVTLCTLGIELSDEGATSALAGVYLPGRMEEIGPRIYVDVAHNPQGVEAFVRTIEDNFSLKKRILFATSHKLEEENMLRQLQDIHGLEQVYQVSMEGRQVDAEDFEHKMEQMITDSDDNTICFIVGSFYLVGEAKRYISRR